MADANLKSSSSVTERFMACESAMRWTDIPTYLASPRQRPIPRIRLMGHWLEQAGFKPDSRVCVHVEDGKLIITPA
ncbi:SymE family type I addiction module toxin [Caballeronia sp. 15711]|uniref:SymE family type I addiction module toxin n=2 Tax=unclassified Caballeronia TaxID=2646786 RepID=UPI0039E6E3A5